jgi:hypothetical protein
MATPEPSKAVPPKSPSRARGSLLRHKTRSQGESVRESEKSLHKLLEDFESGRLNAFGNSDTLQKLNEIRQMQEHLTLRHFEIDQMRLGQDDTKDEASLHELTQTLEKLGSAIQSLHSGQQDNNK